MVIKIKLSHDIFFIYYKNLERISYEIKEGLRTFLFNMVGGENQDASNDGEDEESDI